MKINFQKYHGTGNDFIMIDDRVKSFPINTNLIAQLCERRFGIGADGLILIQPDEVVDFKMVYFNSDGNQSTMCGNGGRCSIRFAHDLGMIIKKTTFSAIDGLHEGVIADDGRIHLKMIDTELATDKENGFFIDTGSPHHIAQVDAVVDVDVFKKGKEIRLAYGDEGTNVNFVEVEADGLHMRTYERGVEDETLSCGTGVTAAALTAFQKGWITSARIPVRTKGGNLEVRLTKTETGFKDVWLIGPTAFVFKGEIRVDA